MVSSPGEEHEGHRVGHHEDGEEVGGRQLACREGADSAACKGTSCCLCYVFMVYEFMIPAEDGIFASRPIPTMAQDQGASYETFILYIGRLTTVAGCWTGLRSLGPAVINL